MNSLIKNRNKGRGFTHLSDLLAFQDCRETNLADMKKVFALWVQMGFISSCLGPNKALDMYCAGQFL